MSLAPGERVLQDYQVEALLYQGRHALVYSGKTGKGHPVAIKLLYTDAPDDAVARFEREATLLERVRHPNVVHVFAHGKTDAGASCLVMEYLGGVSLEVRLGERGWLPWQEAVPILLGVLDGLDAVHAASVVHRNIKPENVVLVPGPSGETAKVVDFRYAKDATSEPLERQRYSTSVGFIVGTPAYMAPEQLMGEPADARSDVYAAALTLYEAITGANPFPSATMLEVIQRSTAPVPPPVAPEGCDAFPPSLVEALVSALAPERSARTMSARVFAMQLRATLRAEDLRF